MYILKDLIITVHHVLSIISLLSNKNFVEFSPISKIDFCLMSASVLWETMKVCIRGELIPYSSYDRKIKREKFEFTERFASLDTIYAVSFCRST